MTAPVLILGGSGGIGFALARRLVGHGRAVHLLARRPDRLQECRQALGGDVGITACDVLDAVALDAAVARVVADHGGTLAGLVYAIGSIILKPLARATPEDFLDAYRLNVVGAAIATRAAANALRAGRGGVVLFSTVAAGSGFPNHVVIAAAKGAWRR